MVKATREGSRVSSIGAGPVGGRLREGTSPGEEREGLWWGDGWQGVVIEGGEVADALLAGRDKEDVGTDLDEEECAARLEGLSGEDLNGAGCGRERTLEDA